MVVENVLQNQMDGSGERELDASRQSWLSCTLCPGWHKVVNKARISALDFTQTFFDRQCGPPMYTHYIFGKFSTQALTVGDGEKHLLVYLLPDVKVKIQSWKFMEVARTLGKVIFLLRSTPTTWWQTWCLFLPQSAEHLVSALASQFGEALIQVL